MAGEAGGLDLRLVLLDVATVRLYSCVMGYIVLTDKRADRSLLYCTTSERSLAHEAFMGPDSDEQAEAFLDWLQGIDPRDERALTRAGFRDLDDAIAAFRATSAYDREGAFIGWAS